MLLREVVKSSLKTLKIWLGILQLWVLPLLWVAVDDLQRCSLISNILWFCKYGEPRKWQFCPMHSAESSVSMLRKVPVWSNPLARKEEWGPEWTRQGSWKSRGCVYGMSKQQLNVQISAASFSQVSVVKIFLKADLMDQQEMIFIMTLTSLIYLLFFLWEHWKDSTLFYICLSEKFPLCGEEMKHSCFSFIF